MILTLFGKRSQQNNQQNNQPVLATPPIVNISLQDVMITYDGINNSSNSVIVAEFTTPNLIVSFQ